MKHASENESKVLHGAFLYDVFTKVITLGKEGAFRQRALDRAQVKPGEAVLDVGCGTGTLALAARRRVGSGSRVCGIDASPEMIARAKKKNRRAHADVEFQEASADALPFAAGTFDVAFSTLMLHHLPPDVLAGCLSEVKRVLKTGGRYFAVDLGGGPHGKKGFLRHFGRHHQFAIEQIEPTLRELGFAPIETGDFGYFGLHYLRALPKK